ncbi:MAG: tetraacyldisaccharide 4'-kinase [Phycisphaerales bacterium]
MSGPLPGLLAPVTISASWFYRLAIRARNARFDRGVGVATVDRPVISVGNLTTGGVGKTPMVMWLAEMLTKHRHRPVIAMRGYGSTRGEPSDEEAEYLDRLGNVPVVADPARAAALGSFLPQHPEIDCVLLDDGFQHRQIARRLDLVLIDASRETFSDRLLPGGHLREPVRNLKRADAVVVTRAERADESLAALIQRYHGKPPIAWSRHVWTRLDLVTPKPSYVGVDWLVRKRVLTMLGVGHPRFIVRQVEAAGAVVALEVPARDHQRYDRAKLAAARDLCRGVDAMVMTAKDWVKVRRLIDLETWPVPVVIPRLAIEVFHGAGELENLVLAAVANSATPPGPRAGSSRGM